MELQAAIAAAPGGAEYIRESKLTKGCWYYFRVRPDDQGHEFYNDGRWANCATEEMSALTPLPAAKLVPVIPQIVIDNAPLGATHVMTEKQYGENALYYKEKNGKRMARYGKNAPEDYWQPMGSWASSTSMTPLPPQAVERTWFPMSQVPVEAGRTSAARQEAIEPPSVGLAAPIVKPADLGTLTPNVRQGDLAGIAAFVPPSPTPAVPAREGRRSTLNVDWRWLA